MTDRTTSSCRNVSCAAALFLLMTMQGCAHVDNKISNASGSPMQAEIDVELRRELTAWYPRTVDDQNGGFYSQFDADWNRLPSQGRFIVFQSRLTWTPAEVARRRPAMAKELLPIAAHGLDFLATQMWDAKNGGFFWEIAEPGAGDSPKPQYQEKHAYGISFGIYAAATVYEANKDRRALNLAVNAFRWLDQHAHDSVYRGYFEALTPDGTPVKRSPGNAGPDPNLDRIGTMYGRKSMNTHIHLLESFTTLYRIWPDRILRERLEELFLIIRDRMPLPPGYLPLYYTLDWKPVPGKVSYGHDVETAFLLTEAAEALGLPDDLTTLDVAKRLWNNALTYGLDKTNGGFFSEGPPAKSADDRKKVWWVQAEALNSLLLMEKHFGTTDPRYRSAFDATWKFTTDHQIDRDRGGWYDEVSEDGTKVLKTEKSNDWKDPYHTVRALLNMSDTLKKLPPR